MKVSGCMSRLGSLGAEIQKQLKSCELEYARVRWRSIVFLGSCSCNFFHWLSHHLQSQLWKESSWCQDREKWTRRWEQMRSQMTATRTSGCDWKMLMLWTSMKQRQQRRRQRHVRAAGILPGCEWSSEYLHLRRRMLFRFWRLRFLAHLKWNVRNWLIQMFGSLTFGGFNQ